MYMYCVYFIACCQWHK